MNNVYGIIPPLFTPLTEQETVDERSLRTIVSRCAESGLHGIFVAGSGGETMALSQSERDAAIRIAIDEAAGRLPVLCGAMDTGTRKVIDNIKRIEQVGGQVAVVTPVFYTKTTGQDDIIRHFDEICRHTALKLVMYNIPGNTHVFMTAETVRRIAEFDRIIGLKDSSANWIHFQQCLESVRPNADFTIFQGTTEMAGISLLCGADGFIPIYSVFFPKLFLQLYEAGRAGDIARTMALQQVANRLSERLTVRGHTTFGAKAVAEAFGMGSSALCEPYVKLSNPERERLLDAARHFDRVISQADDCASPDVQSEMFSAARHKVS